MPRALVMLSGGLDSLLAARILQEHGVTVEAVNFQTAFTGGPALAQAAAAQLQIPLTIITAADDYFALVRRPRFGYGRAANPCLDCRIYFFRHAARLCQERAFDFAASGEVLGQRPASQRRIDLEAIAEHSGFGPRLLRPLSAKHLEPTLAEERGWVPRSRLFEIAGQSHARQRRLAQRFGLRAPESAYVGCALTEAAFAQKVFDLNAREAGRWDYELLALGRHFRVRDAVKVVVGRNAEENAQLRARFAACDRHDVALLEPQNFPGPTALLVGSGTPDTEAFAAALVLRYARRPLPTPPCLTWEQAGKRDVRTAADLPAAQLARTLSDAPARAAPGG